MKLSRNIVFTVFLALAFCGLSSAYDGDGRALRCRLSRTLHRAERNDKPLDFGVPTGRMGAFCEGDSTVFRLFSPRAFEVTLHIYPSATGEAVKDVSMKCSEGVWEARLKGRLFGSFYDFSLLGPDGPGECFDPSVRVSDPCARANVNHDGRSIVVDPGFAWSDQAFRRPPLSELVVYELHVRDYTADASSCVEISHRGKYLGLIEGADGDRVLGNLKQLGVSAVELLPVHEFDNGASPTGTNHWGYMTSHYMSPECYYASGDQGQAVTEFKTLVNGLHRAGLAVILDVVYNHTTEGNEYGPVINFKGVDNRLYYRLTPDFYYWNGTGCGNEFATEHPAVRRFIIDSLKMWVDEYHVDGFRFDLAAGIDKETLSAIADELPKDVYLIAEPWTADWNRALWKKGDLRGSRWSSWNDDFRNTVRAFITTGADQNGLISVIAGSCFLWTSKPTESINYLECHDNDTLDDFLRHDMAANRLGAVILFTSQGIPMLHEGQEFAKNKDGNDNSYDQDNETNYIDWKRKDKFHSVFDFYRGLIAIRAKYPHFKHLSPLSQDNVEWWRHGDGHALGYRLKSADAPDIIVLLNSSSDQWSKFVLPAGAWTVLCDGVSACADGLRDAKGDYSVPPRSGIILVAK